MIYNVIGRAIGLYKENSWYCNQSMFDNIDFSKYIKSDPIKNAGDRYFETNDINVAYKYRMYLDKHWENRAQFEVIEN